MASFHKEKSGIASQDTYVKISLPKYRVLWAKGVPKAIPIIFGLKSLQHTDIQAAFLAFHNKAGSLAR